MIRIGIVFLLSIIFIGPVSPGSPQSATETWERVIQAKGGRERLRQIRILAWSSDQAQSLVQSRSILAERYEHVELFPDRYWRWGDFRPGSLGFNVEVWNGPKHLNWRSSNGASPVSLPWSPASESARLRDIRIHQLVYLLETQFVVPQITKVSKTSKQIAIEGRAEGVASLSYLVNSETYLVESITVVPEVVLTEGTRPVAGLPIDYVFRGYSGVSGIQMPIGLKGLGELHFLINPNVDPLLFETPPDKVASRDAWKIFLTK